MTKFEGTFSGQTTGDGGKWAAIIVGAAVVGVVAYKALGSAASTAGDLLVIVPVTLAGLVVGALVTFVVLKARRPRQAESAGQPAGLWAANPHASPIPQRAAPAIAPVTVINNFGPDLLAEAARLLYATQQQAQPAPVIIPSEREELPR